MTAPPRAATETEAANLALALIGEPAIADLNEDTARARECRRWFAVARDQVQRSRDWNFCTGWVSPAKAVGDAAGPLKGRFPLPTDCLAVRFVTDLEADEWAVEASAADPAGSPAEVMVLVTNADAPQVCYSRRIVQPRLWDAEFLPAFAEQLGAYVAPKLARSRSLAADLRDAARDSIDDAARRDAREKAPSRISNDTSWIRARRR